MASRQSGRLIRRAPLSERIKAKLNPWDLLLWLSEELNSADWDDFDKTFSVPVGLSLNLVFIIAKANVRAISKASDDVFGDSGFSSTRYLPWLAAMTVYALTSLSILNTAYTLLNTRSYRLFQVPVDAAPNTPSARRVRVDSASSGGLWSRVFGTETAEARAHPDPTRDVWEVSVWEPVSVCLSLFTYFSPAHLLVYWVYLPLQPLDPRPSVTISTAILLVAAITVQLQFTRSAFERQHKDSELIYRQVQNEYNAKFVDPNLRPVVREAGTQTNTRGLLPGLTEVVTSSPTTYVNRGFRINPNPNYASHYDPDGALLELPSRSVSTPAVIPPLYKSRPSYSQDSPLSLQQQRHSTHQLSSSREQQQHQNSDQYQGTSSQRGNQQTSQALDSSPYRGIDPTAKSGPVFHSPIHRAAAYSPSVPQSQSASSHFPAQQPTSQTYGQPRSSDPTRPRSPLKPIPPSSRLASPPIRPPSSSLASRFNDLRGSGPPSGPSSELLSGLSSGLSSGRDRDNRFAGRDSGAHRDRGGYSRGQTTSRNADVGYNRMPKRFA